MFLCNPHLGQADYAPFLEETNPSPHSCELGDELLFIKPVARLYWRSSQFGRDAKRWSVDSVLLCILPHDIIGRQRGGNAVQYKYDSEGDSSDCQHLHYNSSNSSVVVTHVTVACLFAEDERAM